MQLLSCYHTVPKNRNDRAGQPTIQPVQSNIQIQCNICFEVIKPPQKKKLRRLHTFHHQCLIDAYSVRIYERNFPMKCPDCNTQVDYQIMKTILSETLFVLYEKILLMNQLLLDKRMFFCPTPDCHGIYEVFPSEFRYLQCIACQKEFCLLFHKPFHGKAMCKVQTKSEIAGFSRECPKCKKDCFKDTGCNHVQCKVCKYKFCYKCGGEKCGPSKCFKLEGKEIS